MALQHPGCGLINSRISFKESEQIIVESDARAEGELFFRFL